MLLIESFEWKTTTLCRHDRGVLEMLERGEKCGLKAERNAGKFECRRNLMREEEEERSGLYRPLPIACFDSASTASLPYPSDVLLRDRR